MTLRDLARPALQAELDLLSDDLSACLSDLESSLLGRDIQGAWRALDGLRAALGWQVEWQEEELPLRWEHDYKES